MKSHRAQLLEFLRPGGIENAKNARALMNWMAAHAISTQPGALAVLLYSEVHRSARVAAVKSLIKR